MKNVNKIIFTITFLNLAGNAQKIVVNVVTKKYVSNAQIKININ